MARIDWATISADLYEDMVAVLLSHLHPESVRIDGSGGDGGRDVQIETPEGLLAFELKSFSGRLTAARRRQVERSLTRAARLDPWRWTLLVPIDFTDGEIKWFKRLQVKTAFPIERKGLTWLDGQFAQRWFIARYFLDHLSDEIVRLATVLDQERAVLARGAPDAIQRAERLVRQLNEIDPYYRFEITTDGARSSVKIIPQYKGAERDRPIGVQAQFLFSNDDEGRAAAEAFRRSIDFGTPVTVPAQYLQEITLDVPAGLGGTFREGTLEVRPSGPVSDPQTFIFACIGSGQSTMAEIPIDLTRTSQGSRGAILEGKDVTGILTVEATIDVPGRKLTVGLSVDTSIPYYPHEMRPLARFLAALSGLNSLSIRSSEGEEIGSCSPVGIGPFIEPEMLIVVEALALIQWASGMTRRVGPGFTREELKSIGIGAALLRGERIEAMWEPIAFTLNSDAPRLAREALLGDDVPFCLESREPHQVHVGGISYPVGKSVRMELLGRIQDTPRTWTEAPIGTRLVMVPGSTNKAFITLVS